MRRFSAKEEARRLVAAPYLADSVSAPVIGFENHLNYVYRPNSNLTEDEAVGLVAIFNSSLLDNYFRVSSGNTQVSATELRAMALPSLQAIQAIGRSVRIAQFDHDSIDAMVIQLAGSKAEQKVAARG